MEQNEKQAIFEAYLNPAYTVGAIAEQFSISKSMVTKIAIEQGAEPRRPKTFGKRGGVKMKHCPKCKRIVTVKDAKFCCYCAADLRTETDRLIERVNKAMTLISFLPAQSRDEMQQLLLDTIKALKRAGKE